MRILWWNEIRYNFDNEQNIILPFHCFPIWKSSSSSSSILWWPFWYWLKEKKKNRGKNILLISVLHIHSNSRMYGQGLIFYSFTHSSNSQKKSNEWSPSQSTEYTSINLMNTHIYTKMRQKKNHRNSLLFACVFMYVIYLLYGI